MEQDETNMEKVPKYSLEIKQSAKGDNYYSFKVRSDDIEELTIMTAQVKQLAEKTCKGEL